MDVPPSDPPCDCDCECKCKCQCKGDCKSSCECCKGQSTHPVRYGSGEFRHQVEVIPASGSGIPWGHTRFWSNQLQLDGDPLSHDNGLGYNWLIEQVPYLHVNSAGDRYTVVLGMGRAVFFSFNSVSGAFTPLYGADNKYTLTDSGGGLLLFTEPNGNRWEFQDMNQGARSGMFYRAVAPGGQETVVVAYQTVGGVERLGTVERSFTSGGSTTFEHYDYVYYSSGSPHEGRLQQVALSRSTDSGATWTNVRAEHYTYYGAGDPDGSLGDLESAVIQSPNGGTWTDEDTYYYRYYVDDAGGIGFQHGLKFIVEPEAFSRLAAVGKNPLTTSVSDADLARYADFYLEYDPVSQRVTKETVNGGQQTFTFVYTTSTLPDDYNRWRRQTVMTRPDGATVTVLTNYIGQVLVSELMDSSGKSWVDYFEFDSQGHNILHAHPSAVSNWTPPAGPGSDFTKTLKSGSGTDVGLIDVTEYAATTTATETTAGDVVGYEKARKVKNGIGGSATLVTLRETKYFAHATDDGTTQGTVYPVARETVYRETGGTGAIHTNYTYDWFDTIAGAEKSGQVLQRTTTLPAIPTLQNGSNVSNMRVERYSDRGELIWIKDERNFMTYNAYDSAKGTLVKTIVDVNTTQTGDFTDLPAGWVTPGGGGLHLITDYTLDDRGRVTLVKGPVHAALDDASATGNHSNSIRSITTTLYLENEVRTAQGYATGAGFTTYTLYNPISITKLDREGRAVEQIQATRGAGTPPPLSTSGNLSPSDTFAQSSYVRWTKNFYDNRGQLRLTRVYYNIPTSGEGSTFSNFTQTAYLYDSMGRQATVTTPGGTQTTTTFDARDLPLTVSVGVNPAAYLQAPPPASWQNPQNAFDVDGDGFVSSIDSVLIINYMNAGQPSQLPEPPNGTTPAGPPPYYDVNGDGFVSSIDSVSVINYLNGNPPAIDKLLVVSYEYDNNADGGDGNLTKETRPVDATAGNDRVTTYTYDWRNRRLTTDGEIDLFVEYAYDNLDRVTVTQRRNTSSGGTLLGKEETKYDELGRVYQTIRTAVNPTTGALGNTLTDNTWYDASGNVVKQQPAGSKTFTKTKYDGAGRPIRTFVGYDTTETSYTSALDTSGDMLFEQTENTYDAASNVTLVNTRRRFHNASTLVTGELKNPTTEPKARVSYLAHWPDGIGRTVAVANYGTNGGTAPTRPATVPARSDTILVTTTEFNARGEAYRTIDPAGRDDRLVFDHAGRQTKTIQNFVDGNPSDVGNPPDQDVTVEYTYPADGRIAQVNTTEQDTTKDQKTIYTYGVSTTTGSTINSKELLAKVTYPDSLDASDVVTYKYNRQGQVTEMRDQNGTVHTYDYDKLGRQTHDRVTTLGSGVDNSVLRISTTYDVRGLVSKITSVNSATVNSGTVQNEVQNDYNDFGQLTAQHQAHSGAVVVGTTPKVQYGYATGSANHVRPTSLTYPNGRVLTYDYTGMDADNLSRIVGLVDGVTHLADYTYLGLGTVVKVNSPQPNLRMDLTLGASADPYDRHFDSFDRLKEIVWQTGTSTDLVRILHGYDRAGNRLWREDPVAFTNGKHFDELYTYDGMYQLKTFQRGDLNGTKNGIVAGTLTFSQNWGFDPLGNWTNFKEDATGDGTFELDQSRIHNKVNEISDITEPVGQAVWPTPVYDRNGNMTTMPQPVAPTASYTATYDAWNRLVKLMSGATTIAIYRYDGLKRRINSGVGVSTTDQHHYYSENWQVLEERVGAASTADRQFVWGLRYIDDLVLRDQGANRLYALQDPNWNVVAITNAASPTVVQERYGYEAYGDTKVLTSAFADRAATSFTWETRYAGYRWDAPSNLFHARHRDLLSALGTWIARDALLIDTQNGYQYVSASPLTFVDPTGLFGISIPLIGAPPPITGLCGNYSISASASAIGIVSVNLGVLPFGLGEAFILGALKRLGFEPAILREMNKGIPRPLLSNSGAIGCPRRSKCCILITHTISLTAFVTITGSGSVSATISLGFISRKISTTFVATITVRMTARAAVNIGVCIPIECQCPPQLYSGVSNITLGTQNRPVAIPYQIPLGEIPLN
jgi:RHS repeat-associated protein